MHQTVNLTSPTSVVRIHPLPPNPTRSKLKSLLRVGFFLVQGLVDSRGGKQSARLRRSEVSTDDLTALGLGCQPCASAQGANPPPPTTQKALTFVSAFCVVGRGEHCTEPQFGLPPTAESCQGPRLRGMAVNTPSHKSPYCLRGTLSGTFLCVAVGGAVVRTTGRALAHSDKPCQGPHLRGMAVNTPLPRFPHY